LEWTPPQGELAFGQADSPAHAMLRDMHPDAVRALGAATEEELDAVFKAWTKDPAAVEGILRQYTYKAIKALGREKADQFKGIEGVRDQGHRGRARAPRGQPRGARGGA
jgi:hypothetical protein